MKFEIEDGVLENVEATDSETSMIIPDGVGSVGFLNFFNFLNLASITLPDSLYDVQGLRDLPKLDNWDNILVSKGSKFFTSLDGVLYNKSMTELIRCPTGKVGVNIPDSVTSIGDKAFSFCVNLTSVSIPEGVTSIHAGAFSHCRKLTSMIIPFNVTDIESGSFDDCTELSSIIIPDLVTSIGDNAFRSCKNLTSIIIGDNVKHIGDRALIDCSKLSSILVSDKNIYFEILDGVLYGNNMTELVKCLQNKNECIIPDSVTTIGIAAFSFCDKLTSIIIPASVKYIGESAFVACTNLKSIILPNSVESIEYGTFMSCTNLISITIPDSVTSIDNGTFDGCESLASIIMPDSITSIEDNTFEDCPNLTIYAPENCYVESYARENGIAFVAKSDHFRVGANQWHETNSSRSVAKNSCNGLDFITSSEDQLYNDFYDSFDDSDEPFGGCIFLISIMSEDIVSIIVERYADQCGESGLSKYDVVTSDDGIPVHLFRESGICMFEISNEGEYGGPLPQSQETLTDIVKYWVKNFFRNDESRNFEGYELDQYIESAEYLEMMNNLKCKGTYYQGRFKYSEDIADCVDPSHMRGFGFAENYIDDYISD
ncbi:MAG: leucine-rich repeat domain-containing protein [Christensenella sp.]|nr:leucine-rich repeat domain-containing protein [Christensenella sp.]